MGFSLAYTFEEMFVLLSNQPQKYLVHLQHLKNNIAIDGSTFSMQLLRQRSVIFPKTYSLCKLYDF